LQQKSLEAQLRLVQEEITNLKRKVVLFEEETNRNRWGIRYSRRMAIMSNLLLGLWIFWSRFLTHVQKQKKSKLLGVMVPNPFSLTNTLQNLNRNRAIQQPSPLNKILYEAYMKAISKSWVFFVGALLLTRHGMYFRFSRTSAHNFFKQSLGKDTSG
jgi:hypothetical protein